MATLEEQSVEQEKPGEQKSEARGKKKTEYLMPNIVVVGATGSGKTTVGWLLARLLGYGFIDLDERIEKLANVPVAQIFNEQGEAKFRELEARAVADLAGVKCHVISVGGGAVIDDSNWDVLRQLGVTVWLSTPPEEIARRLLLDLGELEKRPLLSDVLRESGRNEQHGLLTERLAALIGQRQERYKEAQFRVEDSFSTPETSAQLLKAMLIKDGAIKLPRERRPFDKWQKT